MTGPIDDRVPRPWEGRENPDGCPYIVTCEGLLLLVVDTGDPALDVELMHLVVKLANDDYLNA